MLHDTDVTLSGEKTEERRGGRREEERKEAWREAGQLLMASETPVIKHPKIQTMSIQF